MCTSSFLFFLYRVSPLVLTLTVVQLTGSILPFVNDRQLLIWGSLFPFIFLLISIAERFNVKTKLPEYFESFLPSPSFSLCAVMLPIEPRQVLYH